jgi:hypothetical protein
MPESTRDLHLHLDVHIDDGPEWELDAHIPVPPDYAEQDIEPFVLHEIDKLVVAHERQHFGRARAADIIHQYDLRMRVIEAIIRHAAHNETRQGLAAKILAVIHLDTENLLATYEHVRLED